MRVSCRSLCVTVSLNSLIGPLTSSSRPPDNALDHAGPHLALRSNSNEIAANLAAEEALVRGVVLRPQERLLLLYRNEPCVVVGRNQNIFKEVSLRRANLDGVSVARRSSGGGAVYQDAGNLCLSFFTHRADYEPEKTIQVLRHGLCHAYQIKPARLTTTKRHDLFLDGLKITGSAMRVQRDIAFHHCTLLVATSLAALGQYLHPEGQYVAFRTPSIGSVRSPVTTLAASGLLGGRGDGIVPPRAAVADAEEKLAAFFLSHGPFIAGHAAPWDLTLTEILANRSAGVSDESASIMTLDVAEAIRGPADDTGAPFLMGEKRPLSSMDTRSIPGEMARLESVDWQFAMPRFTTEVAVGADEVAAALAESLPGCHVPDHLIPRLLGLGDAAECLALVLTTTVDRRRVADVAAHALPRAAVEALGQQYAFAEKSKGGPEATPLPLPVPPAATADGARAVDWLQSYLQALLVGHDCDDTVSTLLSLSADGEDAEVHRRGLWMELGRSDDAVNAAAELPADFREEALLATVQAVVRVWRSKNGFDFAD